ncbi:hypothetical protein QYS49_32000 [Marivirga salinae]|uniref:VWA domain-containing protein n=1 Tax=Marivirga salinarum TaxID=3059078 RepID=A0AA51REN2_9BACT|nr:hypothetical protein [Marivirga sp. BDSF4-3]WMN11985.1 hypothetical protein QYS49_32000 [Marivirga sp. BDSF4-3]
MLKTAYSPYWLILCLVLGLVYAYMLYSRKKEPWTPVWNKVLFVLRFLVVSIIGYLFLEPFLNIQKTTSEPSKIIFLWDDSESLSKSENDLQIYWQELQQLRSDLEDKKGVDIPILGLNGNVLSEEDSIKNDRKESPLNAAIKNTGESFDNKLISEVILFSDGIYNQGISPDYYAFPFQLSTVGLGDSTQKKDVVLQQIRYNKVAYQGNQFPVEADILHTGFEGENSRVSLRNNGEIIAQKLVGFKNEREVSTVQFLVDAEKTGFQDYTVEVEILEDEFNTQNNSKNAYINIVEGKKNILLLAPYPHPDIKALSAAIDGNDNYDFTLAIDGISEENVKKLDEYDLAILFHLPNIKNSFDSEIRKLKNAETPLWFVTGSQLNFRRHNELNESVDLVPSSESDEAFAYVNTNFELFELSNEQEEILDELPPASMPFAKHNFHPLSKGLFMKKVGNVKTEEAVFVFYNNDEIRQATLLVQNFRIWRMVEYLNTQSHDFFDDWVMKSIRYLTAKNQKDRFKVFPKKEAFSDNEEVDFQVEIYNEVYDRIYGIPVKLELKSSNDSIYNFEFTPDRLKPDFVVGNLPGGIYEYSATTTIQDRAFESVGQFVVEEFDIESQNLQADFDLLARTAQKNQGKFFYSNQTDDLRDYLNAKEYPRILSGESETVPLTQNIIPYLLIFLLVIGEWFIRRYFGSY